VAASNEYSVAVVGAGPVGLSAALQLGMNGVDVLVLEQRGTQSTHPRAHVVNARTMELFRTWGIADVVCSAGLPPDLATGFGWLTSLSSDAFATLNYVDDHTAELHSPERLCSCAQDRVESALYDRVSEIDSVTVQFDSEVVALAEHEDGAVLTVRRNGLDHDVRARYVIAADGANSTVRDLSGISLSRSEPLGRRMNIYFHADLHEVTRSRPYMLWFVYAAKTQGILIVLDPTRWVYSVELDPQRDPPGDFGRPQCHELIRAAVGVDDLEVDVVSVMPWQVDMAVASRFRSGPVFLAGDAAHRFPPMGGFGMNSGIQDTHNLAWKLSAVLNGTAGESLLDSYDAERRPVADYNAAQSMDNARRQKQSAAMLTKQETLRQLASPDGEQIRNDIAAGIGMLSEEFHAQGQVFGSVYRSAAVIDDGTPACESTITDYRPTARPGARAPHVRLRTDSGRCVSTIELLDGHWTLLTFGDASAWRRAADHVQSEVGIPLRTFGIGEDFGDGVDLVDAEQPGVWRTVYGLDAGGAVVVRPDGHVATRWCRPPAQREEQALKIALACVLGRAGTTRTPASTAGAVRGR